MPATVVQLTIKEILDGLDLAAQSMSFGGKTTIEPDVLAGAITALRRMQETPAGSGRQLHLRINVPSVGEVEAAGDEAVVQQIVKQVFAGLTKTQQPAPE